MVPQRVPLLTRSPACPHHFAVELGLHPSVASATSSILVLVSVLLCEKRPADLSPLSALAPFTLLMAPARPPAHPCARASSQASSSSSLTSFAAASRLNVEFAAIYGGSCLLPAAAGTFLISLAVKRSGRPSSLVFLLAGVMALGVAITAAFSIRRAIQDLSEGHDVGFTAICA